MSERGGAATRDLHGRDQRPQDRCNRPGHVPRSSAHPCRSVASIRAGRNHRNHAACSTSHVELLPHLTAVPRVAGGWLATTKERTRVQYLFTLPIFALRQRSGETLPPPEPPPTPPPSDRCQLCRRLGGHPPPALLTSAARCRSSATTKDRTSTSSTLCTFSAKLRNCSWWWRDAGCTKHTRRCEMGAKSRTGQLALNLPVCNG